MLHATLRGISWHSIARLGSCLVSRLDSGLCHLESMLYTLLSLISSPTSRTTCDVDLTQPILRVLNGNRGISVRLIFCQSILAELTQHQQHVETPRNRHPWPHLQVEALPTLTVTASRIEVLHVYYLACNRYIECKLSSPPSPRWRNPLSISSAAQEHGSAF